MHAAVNGGCSHPLASRTSCHARPWWACSSCPESGPCPMPCPTDARHLSLRELQGARGWLFWLRSGWSASSARRRCHTALWQVSETSSWIPIVTPVICMVCALCPDGIRARESHICEDGMPQSPLGVSNGASMAGTRCTCLESSLPLGLSPGEDVSRAHVPPPLPDPHTSPRRTQGSAINLLARIAHTGVAGLLSAVLFKDRRVPCWPGRSCTDTRLTAVFLSRRHGMCLFSWTGMLSGWQPLDRTG